MDDIKLPDSPLFNYWLTFTDSNHWTGKLCKPHFGHVYVTMKDEFNWIVLNPRRSRLLVEIAPYPVTTDVPLEMAKENDTVIKLTFYPRHTYDAHRYFGLLHCLTYAKYILGLPLVALTPYSLYKKLLSLSNIEKCTHRIQCVEQIKGIDYGTSGRFC